MYLNASDARGASGHTQVEDARQLGRFLLTVFSLPEAQQLKINNYSAWDTFARKAFPDQQLTVKSDFGKLVVALVRRRAQLWGSFKHAARHSPP